MAGRKVTVHVVESAAGHLDEYPDGRVELFPGDVAPDWLELGEHVFAKQDDDSSAEPAKAAPAKAAAQK
jgi:hypothetical protein